MKNKSKKRPGKAILKKLSSSYIFLLEEVEAGVGPQHKEPPAPFGNAGHLGSGHDGPAQLPEVPGVEDGLRVVEATLGHVDGVLRVGQLGDSGQAQL